MKIREVTTTVVNAKLRNWVFVKVVTDEPGLVGWGEATLEWRTQAVVGAVADFAPLLVGQDPMRAGYLWQSLARHPFFRGGIIGLSALSGIDQALWDLRGKSLGVPVWQLLGGAVRDRVRMYDHLGGGDSNVVYGAASPGGFAEAAERSVADGFTALKILAVPVGAALPDAPQVRQAVQLLKAVREAVGEGVEVMIDFHGRTSPAGAIRYARAFEEYSPWFIEEPCQPEDIAGTAQVARAISTPVATGERLVDATAFRDLLDTRAAAVIQPDVSHVGGITAITKIAALAEPYQVSLAPHNPLGPIATWANLQVDFATSNFLAQEIMRADVPWRNDVVTTPIEIVGGYVELPTRPGLGVELDERAAAAHPYESEERIRTHLADGSVGDW